MMLQGTWLSGWQVGEVPHAFLNKNDNGMREYIFDHNTWRPQAAYDAELGTSDGRDNRDEYCSYTSEAYDDEAQYQG